MASCSPIKKQIIRGIVGVGLLVAAAFAFKTNFELSVLLVALSLFPLKGCPACWIVETCEVVDKSKRDKK
ncbi:MAG: hypothetical protein PW788_13830 [Micavibrio sp.]|nr:hypothetical protein [Micavibrio sp.]